MNRVRIPSFLQALLGDFRDSLSKPQFAHLCSAVLALLMNRRRSKLTHLASTRPYAKDRTSLGWFLSHSDWQAERLLEQAATRLLRRMRPRQGEVLYLILDDTRIAKRGREMGWLSKIYDHVAQRFVRGHFVVTAAVNFRGVTLPWAFHLWAPKNTPGVPYRKTTEIAAILIRSFQAPKGLKVRVLFDAFYLCPSVVHECEERSFHWFSIAARNRKFRRLWGKSRRIAELAPGVLRHGAHSVRLPRSRSRAQMRIASLDGWLSRIGPVRLVLSRRPSDAAKHARAIVTDAMHLPARSIVLAYERRWSIEVYQPEGRSSVRLYQLAV